MLSPRERACISWICHGKSVGEIAALEGKTIADIEANLERARLALGALSLNDAVTQVCQIYRLCSGG